MPPKFSGLVASFGAAVAPRPTRRDWDCAIRRKPRCGSFPRRRATEITKKTAKVKARRRSKIKVMFKGWLGFRCHLDFITQRWYSLRLRIEETDRFPLSSNLLAAGAGFPRRKRPTPSPTRRVTEQREKDTEEGEDCEREEGNIGGRGHAFLFTDSFAWVRGRWSFGSAGVSDRSDQAAARIFIRSAGDETRLRASASNPAIIKMPPTATSSL